MFRGRTYKQQGGYRGNAVRFADVDGGVATTAYSYSMTEDEKHEMARRITAALNFTKNITTELMEDSTPLV